MSTSPLSNVLLPAVFVSSAVFSTLTLPLALIKSEPMVIEIPPFFSGEIQPIFDGQHKEIAIPYIGFSIVVSVGAGMATVEVYRRWQQLRESATAEQESPTPTADSPALEAQPEAIEMPEYRPQVSAIDLPPLDEVFSPQVITTPDPTPEAEDIAIEAAEPVVEFPPTLSPQPPVLTLVSTPPDLSHVVQGNNVVQLESYRLRVVEPVEQLDLAGAKILESRQQYQTCRIQVPHLKRRLFAISFNGQYYSFLRVEKTKEKALEVLAKLGDRVGETAIAKTEKGYTIWARESEVS